MPKNTKKEEMDMIEQNPIKKRDTSIILKNQAIITRGNNKFKIPLKELLTDQLSGYLCKKCGHIWFPKDRKKNKLPAKCSKCNDNYWFLSKEDTRKILKKRNKTTYSTETKQITGDESDDNTGKKEVLKKPKW